jgi:hypothetical protein
MTTLTEVITGNVIDYEIEYRIHATRRMFQRTIDNEEVEFILKNGQIIERYDNDFPLPSLLLNGKTEAGRPLHVVVGMNLPERKLVIIITNKPETALWTEDFSRRLKI